MTRDEHLALLSQALSTPHGVALQIRTYRHPRRPGRPAVPMEGCGHCPYDPRGGTPKRWRIIFALHDHRDELDSGELRHCDLATMIDVSISYFSTTKNSVWGQWMLRKFASMEGAQDAESEGDNR